jgi:hypothetical protein
MTARLQTNVFVRSLLLLVINLTMLRIDRISHPYDNLK